MSVLAEPPPQEVRDAARGIFERDEFQRSVPPLERFFRWLSDRIAEFLDRFTPDAPVGGAPAGGGLAQVVAFVVIVVLAIALIVLIVHLVRRAPARRRKAGAPPDEVRIEIDEARTVDEWDAVAERWENQGLWKEALRARYRQLVRRLIDIDALPTVPGRTTRELCVDLMASRPDASGPFEEATRLFELAWYADEATGPADNQRFRHLSRSVVEICRSTRRELVGAET